MGDEIAVEYFSHWDNDTINTTAELNIETLEVFNIKSVDIDDSYEHLNSEEISIIYNGEYYDFDIEDGELTTYAKVKLSKFIKDRF